ncbi:MAG TPA: hypothetical protein VIK91_12895 [Nannocystis sp.]
MTRARVAVNVLKNMSELTCANSPTSPDAPGAPPVASAAALRLRVGEPGDAEAMLAVKRRLRMQPDRAGEASRGGFLLGSTREQYEALLRRAHVDVLLDRGAVVGFITALPDAVLRESDLWRRRAQIAGEDGPFDPAVLAAFEARRLGYIDQLAVLPDPMYRPFGPVLAYRALTRLLAAGCELVFTTVVTRPLRNLATLPLLAAVGAIRLGAIEEVYPEVGPVTSDVYCVTAAALTDAGDARRRARRASLERWTARLTHAGA